MCFCVVNILKASVFSVWCDDASIVVKIADLCRSMDDTSCFNVL